MGRKNRGRGGSWWNRYSDSYNDDLYSNTRRQHEERLAATTKKVYDEDGFLIEGGDQEEVSGQEKPKTKYLATWDSESGYSGYNYGFNQSFKGDQNKSHKSYNSYWNKYEKSGEDAGWSGYGQFKQATLTYKYVQQMANTIASQGKIKIEVGNTWVSDVEHRKLTYNPASLMYGTKGELLATLLHEVGKIANSTARPKLVSKYLTQYGDPAFTASSVFEGMRIDMKMLKAYPSAGEVYDSNATVVKRTVQEYYKRGEIFRQAFKENAQNMLEQVKHLVQNQMKIIHQAFPNNPEMIEKSIQPFIDQICINNFGRAMGNIDEIEANFQVFYDKLDEEPMMDEYVGEMLRETYGIKDLKEKPKADPKSYVEKTVKFVEKGAKLPTNQDVIDMMDQNVYPEIEPLLRQMIEGPQASKDVFGENMAKQMARNALQRAKYAQEAAGLSDQDQNGDQSKNGNGEGRGEMQPRLPGKGRSDEGLPIEWQKGDYNSLRDSVDYEIKQLTARLNFIKREENAMKFEGNHRRGKLDSKRLYRFATGNTRLFKRKMEKRDTIRSFAFSAMVDISGSMQGNRIINTTRALIILAEVFDKFDIPLEIITYNGLAKVLKTHDQKLDKNLRNTIGGLVHMATGGTTLAKALDETKIGQCSEANKIAIVLSDGDTENHSWLDNTYFIPWEKKGIKSMAIGIETGDHIKTLCNGNGQNVQYSSELPDVFTNILKRLIKR